MSFNDDVTGQMPDHIRGKLHWAGGYSDDETAGETYCNAAWETDASMQDCADADAYFHEAFPDLARITHTGHCPEEICGEKNWMDGRK